MIAFFLTPLGRRIGLSIAALLVIFGVYKAVQHEAYQRGQIAGQRKAWETAEKQNLAQWAEIQKKLDQQKLEADKRVEVVRKKYEDFLPKEADIKADIKEHEATFEEKHEALEPAVAAALPETPEPVRAELAVYREETATLRADIQRLVDLLAESKEIITAQDAAFEKATTVQAAQIDQLIQERDFYKTAFHESPPKKKKCGVVKIIFTAGLCRL